MVPLTTALFGLMIAYCGLAINSSAVLTGAANVTDAHNRATVMTGVRIFKQFGAVVSPIVSGRLAVVDMRLPFLLASVCAVIGLLSALLLAPMLNRLSSLLRKRDFKFLDGV